MPILEVMPFSSNLYFNDFKDVKFEIVTIKYKHCFYSNIVMKNVQISV